MEFLTAMKNPPIGGLKVGQGVSVSRSAHQPRHRAAKVVSRHQSQAAPAVAGRK
jgi:hypothetical protein